MGQPITIFIHTKRKGLGLSDNPDDLGDSVLPSVEETDEESEETDMMMEGELVTEGNRLEIRYRESELTGMAGSETVIGFDLDQRELVTMVRDGTVSTALIFEPGKRHICVYHTPFSCFEVIVYTKSVRNALLEEGMLDLDYCIEIKGVSAEHCRISLSVK